MSGPHAGHLLRVRDGHEAKVGYAELFFDLVYVFAVTQVSHFLVGHLTPIGALQSMLLWFTVWLGWQYTAWMTNWFDPETTAVRVALFGLMLGGLVMAAALPEAFGSRGLVFAAAYAAMQVGRSLFCRWQLRGGHPLAANYSRILAWSCWSAVFWIAGGLLEGAPRMALWMVAIASEYIAPMFRYPVPGLGHSDSRAEWTIEGGHLVERCALFMIVALGESVLETGATLAHVGAWSGPVLIAFTVSFIASLAAWWLYFNLGVKHATHVIRRADDPGRLGAFLHYMHVLIFAGIIVIAVGNELVIAHPDGHVAMTQLLVLLGGPALFVAGIGMCKRAVYGHFPLSHWIGLAALALLALFATRTDLLLASGLAAAVLVLIAAIETRAPAQPSALLRGWA